MNQIKFDGQSLITPQAMAGIHVSPDAQPAGEEFETGKAELALILSIAQQRFEGDADAVVTLERVTEDLHKLRARLQPTVWQALIPIAQNHPASEFFLQDPFTRWSFDKPRGYSGDACLLDFIYGSPAVADEIDKASALGKVLYSRTRRSLSSEAVRERRDIIARQVDGIAAAKGNDAEVMAIAAGHLREAQCSAALKEARLGRWIALDQDPLSLDSISRDFVDTAVSTRNGSVLGLLKRAYDLGSFDFIYAAGLYDYLSPGVAARLTQRCLEMLKPDGVFLFANFSNEMSDDGFMETFMNWSLLQRTEADMWSIINASVDRNRVEAEAYFGENRNIVYGVIRKRS